MILIDDIINQIRTFITAEEVGLKEFFLKVFTKNIIFSDFPNSNLHDFFLDENKKLLIKTIFENSFKKLIIKRAIFEEFWKILNSEIESLISTIKKPERKQIINENPCNQIYIIYNIINFISQ